jgi:hypothetical protein
MGVLFKPTICIATGLIAGSIFGIFGILAMLISPSTYYQIAGVVSWRLNWPSVIQSHFENMMTSHQLRGIR